MYTGNDLTKITDEGVKWLTNPIVLDINAHLITATPINTSSSVGTSGCQNSTPEVWVADYGNGTFTVAVFNLGYGAIRDCCSIPLASVITGSAPKMGAAAHDVWKDASLGTLHTTLAIGGVPAHGSRLLILTLLQS
jgi:hypothetical protein